MRPSVIIGFDQSYEDTGVCILEYGKVRTLMRLNWVNKDVKPAKRLHVRECLVSAINHALKRGHSREEILVIFERTRLHGMGKDGKSFLNIGYLYSAGALNSTIVDICFDHKIKCVSVDTRAWKTAVLGTTQKVNNEYGVPPEKYLMVQKCINDGLENKIIEHITTRKTKGTFTRPDGEKYRYNDNIADAYGIALAAIKCKPSLLKTEE